MIIWLTGQPGSGKTTIAQALYDQDVVDVVIDGDDLRRLYSHHGKNIGGAQYGERDRHANVARAQDLALFLHDKGFAVAVALVSPYKAQREEFKARLGELNLCEVYLSSDRSLRREYHADFYDPPTSKCLRINTDLCDVTYCVHEIVWYIERIRENDEAMS